MCTAIHGNPGRARVLSDMRGRKMAEYVPSSPMGSESVRAIEAVLSELSQLRAIAKELAWSLEQMVIVMKMEGINHKDYDLLGLAVNSALAKYKELTND